MSTTTLQQKVQTQLTESLILNAQLLGTQALADLQCLLGVSILQLKTLPTDFAETAHLVTFTGELLLPASSSSDPSSSVTLTAEIALFDDTNGNRQAVIQLHQSIEDYLNQTDALIQLNPNDTTAAEDLFSLYARISSGNTFGDKIIYSSLDVKDIKNTNYNDHFSATIPQANFQRGLNFKIEVGILSTVQDYLADMIGGNNKSSSSYGVVKSKNSSLQAFLNATQQNSSPEPYLFIDQDFDASMTLLSGHLELSLKQLSLGFPTKNKTAEAPEISFDASATIGSDTLDLEVDFFLYQRMVAFKFNSFPTLRELLTSFCSPESYFAAPFDKLLDIELASLELVFDPIEKELTAIQLEVTSIAPITLLDNLVAIEPTLTLDVLNPTDENKRQFQGLFTASWEFGSTTFDSSLTYPAFDFSAEMAQGQQLDLTSVMNSIMKGVHLPEIDINKLSVKGNYTQKTFNFKLDINSNWVIPLLGGNSLEIEQIQLGMTSSNSQRDYQMAGVIQLDTLPISVSADYDGQNWNFNGSAYPNPPIFLRNILRALLSSPEDAVVLNDIINNFPNFGIDSLQFNYNGGDHTFSFDLGVVLKINTAASGKTSYPFDLSVAKEQTSSGLSWVIKGNSEFKTPMKLSDLMTDVMSSFGFAQSSNFTMPSQITAMGLEITQISFSYHGDTKTFVFDLELSEDSASTAHVSSLTSDISPSGSHTFSSFTLTAIEGGSITANLKIDTDSGVNLNDLVDLKDDNLTIFTGKTIPLTSLDFTFDFDDGTQVSFVATFTHNTKAFEFTGVFQDNPSGNKYFGGSIKGVNGDALNFLGGSFPIKIEIKDLFLAKLKPASGPSNTLYGSEVTVDADFDLKKLKVVGEFLNEAQFSFNSLRITHVQHTISATDLSKVNGFLKQLNVAPLVTSQSSVSNTSPKSSPFPQGYSLQGTLVLGDNLFTIPLHTDYTPAPPQGGGQGSAKPGKSSTTPAPVAKKFGPVEIKSIGLGISDGDVVFKFSGGLTLGPLTFEFMDLQVKSSMSEFDPSLSLQGLGIDVKKPPLTLEGLFMEGTLDVPIPNYHTRTITPQPLKDYSGSISISYKQYTLSALGSYAKLPDGANTFFVYGFLGAPLGGPPFFFVTGAAAGFGYNRAFTLPTVDGISTYPLIEPVMPAAAGNPANFSFTSMNQKFMPTQGDYWGAVGVKGESFKMVNSFVLLDVQIGKQLEIDIIGLSNMQFPKPSEDSATPPLAKITVGLVARIIPERGIVTINGAFQPGSYVYNPLAKISGGFALLSVFEPQSPTSPWYGAQPGDFVFTIGGYASNFQAPSYYPTAARLQLLWQVSSLLSVKAQAYFAITPKALMAGGNISANFNAGGALAIHVAFNMGADFIIFWKPYHYEAAIYVSLSVTASINIDLWLFTIHMNIHFDLSANLNVWGPSFSGHAAVHVHMIVSFTVGISFGDAPKIVNPIDWAEFSSTLLPDADKVITTKVTNGIISSLSRPSKSDPTVSTPVVNAKEVALCLSTAVPVKSLTYNSKPAEIATNAKGNQVIVQTANIGSMTADTITASFGIKPMANTKDDFSTSELSFSITKADDPTFDPTSSFSIQPIYKNLPSAMWEAAETSGTVPTAEGSSNLIADLLCGLEITTVSPTKANPYPFPSTHYDNIYTPAATEETTFSYTSAGFSNTTT